MSNETDIVDDETELKSGEPEDSHWYDKPGRLEKLRLPWHADPLKIRKLRSFLSFNMGLLAAFSIFLLTIRAYDTFNKQSLLYKIDELDDIIREEIDHFELEFNYAGSIYSGTVSIEKQGSSEIKVLELCETFESDTLFYLRDGHNNGPKVVDFSTYDDYLMVKRPTEYGLPEDFAEQFDRCDMFDSDELMSKIEYAWEQIIDEFTDAAKSERKYSKI